MFNHCISYNRVWLLFFVFILAQVNESNGSFEMTVNKVNTFIDPINYLSTGCSGIVSFQLTANKKIYTTEIYVDGPQSGFTSSYGVLLQSREMDLNKQILMTKFQMKQDAIGTIVLKVYNMTQSINQTIPTNKTIQCIGIDRSNFQILKLYSSRSYMNNPFPDYSYSVSVLYINLNFNISNGNYYRYLQCQTGDLSITCSCTFLGYNYDTQFCMLFPSPNIQYQSLQPKLNISLTLQDYKYQIWFGVDNPFPWNITRTSIIRSIESYPINGYNFTEDFRLQSASRTSLTQIVTIENINSLIKCSHGFYSMVAKNQTHTTFQYNYHFIYYDGTNTSNRIQSSLLDSSSYTFNTYSIIANRAPFSSISSYELFTDEDNNSTFVIFTMSTGILFDYSLNYKSDDFIDNIEIIIRSPTKSNSSNLYEYQYVIPIHEYYIDAIDTCSFNPYGSSMNVIIPNKNITEEWIIRVNSIIVEIATSKTYIVTISVTSNIGISKIFYYLSKFDSSNLIKGDENEGIYQFEVLSNQQLTMYIFNYRGDSIDIFEGEAYNDDLDILQRPIVDLSKIKVEVIDFTYFRFNKTEIEFPNKDSMVYNTLYLNISKSIPDFIPFIQYNDEYIFYGQFDYDLQLYVINFTLETWIIDPNGYSIGDANNHIYPFKYSEIVAVLNANDYTISILNPDLNNIKPIIKELYSFQTLTSIGWTMRIEDSWNGFKNGTIEIISQYDNTPFIINITESNRISGDRFDGVYNITLNIPPSHCKVVSGSNEIFVLNKAKLSDGNPFTVEFEQINAIIGTIYENSLKIIHICSGTQEYDLPKLVSISFNPTIEVGGYDRRVNISFTTTDLQYTSFYSGISNKHNPIIYLTSENSNHFQIESTLISHNETHFNYLATSQLPYAFGYKLIYVSVYRIVDNQKNYHSYSALDLRNLSLPYYMTRQFTSMIPILERSTSYLKPSGANRNRNQLLTVYGRSLSPVYGGSLKVKIDYQDGKGFQEVIPISNTSIYIQFNIVPLQYDQIVIQVEVNGVKSNDLTIKAIIPIIIPNIVIPTQTPSTLPPHPSLCPGTPACNNRGSCDINFGCECESPWVGPSCNSEIIIITPPSPQPEPTTGSNITTDKDTTITSVIDIKEIREIDELDNIVKSYVISQWNLTDLTSSSTNPTYLYQSQLNGTTTMINTTIIFFKSATNITFGNQILLMQQSSIKFTIEISEYNFTSKMNSLQVIMESTIKGSDSDSCSSKQIGSDSNDNVKWIKMNIDKTSLYGRFIDFGIIDKRISNITNKIIYDSDQSDSTQFRSIKVGMTIPYYEESVYLDPDFSNLIDVNDDNNDLICKSKKKLSSGAIVGIVVGCVVFLALVIATILFLYKKSKMNQEVKRIALKLQK